jgi:hypothetical protein
LRRCLAGRRSTGAPRTRYVMAGHGCRNRSLVANFHLYVLIRTLGVGLALAALAVAVLAALE